MENNNNNNNSSSSSSLLRGSHFGFFKNRNWNFVNNFWFSVTNSGNIPLWISKKENQNNNNNENNNNNNNNNNENNNENNNYGITNLQSIHLCIGDEYNRYGENYYRKTFAIQIGYVGSKYQGYQSQGNKNINISTVEDDIRNALNRSIVAAGRTDKGVSALSQIVSFHSTTGDLDDNIIKQKLSEHPAVKEGKLAVFDCQTVPRKFHALFSATWRRYIYLFPLNSPQLAQEIFNKRKNKKQTADERVDNHDGDDDNCDDDNDEIQVGNHDDDIYPLENILYYPLGEYFNESINSTGQLDKNSLIDVDITFINQMLERITNKLLHFNGFAFKEIRGTEENRGDECILYVAQAFIVDITPPTSSTPQLALSIELVGNRFLRRMVRILVSTVIRECQIPHEKRDVRKLEQICETGIREQAALPAPAVGLCMAGVGYDLEDLSKSKFTATNPKTIEKNKRKRDERERKKQELNNNNNNNIEENENQRIKSKLDSELELEPKLEIDNNSTTTQLNGNS